jgi:hypothetical protein
LVLEGTFSDASGEAHEGSYVRNPINSVHAPWSSNGCVILVKLCQMTDPTESRVVVDMNSSEAKWQKEESEEGLREVLHLYSNANTGEKVK